MELKRDNKGNFYKIEKIYTSVLNTTLISKEEYLTILEKKLFLLLKYKKELGSFCNIKELQKEIKSLKN